MAGPVASDAKGGDELLLELLRAIVARDVARVSELLGRSPELAAAALGAGATRQESTSHFFDAIKHYAYAGDTALHLASAALEPEIVALLLAKGANVRARNRRGAEPLHYACDGGPALQAEKPKAQARVVELLLGAGAAANALDKSGVGPLHRATRSRSLEAVDALLAGGAAVSLHNNSGSSSLHLAVQDTGKSGSGSEESRAAQAEIIQRLLAHGARPSDRSASGKTVLECARADWVRQLLAGA